MFDYILIEEIGLTEKEKQIIMTLARKSETSYLFFSYTEILQKLDEVDVWSAVLSEEVNEVCAFFILLIILVINK